MRTLKLELTRSEECYIIALAILINGHNLNYSHNSHNSLIGLYNLFTIRAFKGCSKDDK